MTTAPIADAPEKNVDRPVEANPEPGDIRRDVPTRRDVVRSGVKLVFLAPVISTFFAHEAYASNYSCYPQGHDCLVGGGFENCCPGLICQGVAVGTCQD